jgi:hypothetical protein
MMLSRHFGTLISSSGASIAMLGAVTANDFVAWTGAAIGIMSAFATWAWTQYHNYRETRRKEDVEDQHSLTEAITERLRAELSLEKQIAENGEKLEVLKRMIDEFVQRVRTERCPLIDKDSPCQQ